MTRRITVKVKPNSKKPGIDVLEDGSYVVRVRARPVDGAANAACIKAIATFFSVSPSSITLVSGASSRTKIFDLLP